MIETSELRDLVSRYRTSGPRYTSYPTALQFESLPETTLTEHLQRAVLRRAEPWSVYVHVPFCRHRCTFCACAVVATPHRDRVVPGYLNALRNELRVLEPHLGERRHVAQLHWGGGTPTYFEPDQLVALSTMLREHFVVDGETEFSVEVDPRVTSSAHLDALAELRVNRISVGVQDLDAHVQSLIGRHQSEGQTRTLVEGARARGILSVNVDLVYGLPGQTVAGLLRTVEAVSNLRPQRVALYGYAHVPWMRSHQKRISAEDLPDAPARLAMFLAARERFESLGYRAIGLDHFALPDDALARADDAGTLKRNFMGYTVAAGTDLLGLGVTAIGDIAGAIVQNATHLATYERRVAEGRLPVERGVVRSAEDVLRNEVIGSLMCRHVVVKAEIERRFGIERFDTSFQRELEELERFVTDGLVEVSRDSVQITQRGRPFVRNVAMMFDVHLRNASKDTRRHSATV